MAKALIFSGQGSKINVKDDVIYQKYNKEFIRADEILYYSLEELIKKDENGLLGRTLFDQPAIFFISCIFFKEFIEKQKDVHIDYLAGHSLGEFAALYAANVFDLETGLTIVLKRAQLMNRCTNGAMAAVIGLDETIIADSIKNIPDIFIANYNTELQTVISGKKESIDTAREILIDKGASGYHILKVSCPCHTPMLLEASEEFRKYLDKFTFNKPNYKVISNYTAREIDIDNIKDELSNQLIYPVKWKHTIEYLIDSGVNDFKCIEPSEVMEKMLKYNLKEIS